MLVPFSQFFSNFDTTATKLHFFLVEKHLVFGGSLPYLWEFFEGYRLGISGGF